MIRLKTEIVAPTVQSASRRFSGLLAGLESGPVISWGLLDVMFLRPVQKATNNVRDPYALPFDALELVEVPTYGTVVLRNTAKSRLIVPMHIGFFQPGAQNHATSRTLILEGRQTTKVTDCFCVQAAQGGLLREAQQRFLVLPLGLRQAALSRKREVGYSRLWDKIDQYTRHYGVATGGHLERFLRPNFRRLLPLRHAVETPADHVGAAYFVAGRLAGVEVAPNAEYWRGLAPILAMYCYGPAALLADRRGHERVSEPIDLESLVDLDDLSRRLDNVRAREASGRADVVEQLDRFDFEEVVEEERDSLRLATIGKESWTGQLVRDQQELAYASVFRDVLAEMGPRPAKRG